MRNFFYSTKFKISLAIFTACFLGVFFAAVSNSGSSPVSNVLSYITTPISNAAAYVCDIFNDFNANFVSSKKYIEEISEIKEQNANLKSQLIEYEKALHKLKAYESFLDVKDKNPDFDFTPASIILRDTSEIYGSFTINKGKNDSIKINDPVIFGNALVGIVKEVNENTSVVYTLYNPKVNVSAYDIRTREDCYTKCDVTLSLSNNIKLLGLTKSTPVVAGGLICTSGTGGIFPKDLIIGTVLEIKTDEAGSSSYAILKPEVDYSQLTDIFIITDFEGKSE